MRYSMVLLGQKDKEAMMVTKMMIKLLKTKKQQLDSKSLIMITAQKRSLEKPTEVMTALIKEMKNLRGLLNSEKTLLSV